MLGGGDPVGVDRLDVIGVGLAAPADEEALGDRAAPRRPRAAAPAAGRRRAPTARRTTAPSPTRGRGRRAPARRRCRSADCKPHSGAEHRQRRLHVDARVAGAHGERVRLGGRQAGLEARRRPAGPRPARTARCRPAPRCRRRDSAARRPRGRARRSRWRTRRRPQARLDFAHVGCSPGSGGRLARAVTPRLALRCRTRAIEHQRRRAGRRAVVEARGAGVRAADPHARRARPRCRACAPRRSATMPERAARRVGRARARTSSGRPSAPATSAGREPGEREPVVDQRDGRAVGRRPLDGGAHAGVDRLAQLARLGEHRGRSAHRLRRAAPARTSQVTTSSTSAGIRRRGASARAACSRNRAPDGRRASTSTARRERVDRAAGRGRITR